MILRINHLASTANPIKYMLKNQGVEENFLIKEEVQCECRTIENVHYLIIRLNMTVAYCGRYSK